MTFLRITSLLSMLALALIPTANARDYFIFSIGYYDVLDNNDALDLRAEYRPNSVIFKKLPGLRPWAGLQLTSHASAWLGGGLLYDYDINEKLRLTPMLGVGLYTQGSSDLDLGHPIEFRSQLELSYKLENDTRIGLGFSHTSNAGLDSDNPGTEIISLSWHVPFDKLF